MPLLIDGELWPARMLRNFLAVNRALTFEDTETIVHNLTAAAATHGPIAFPVNFTACMDTDGPLFSDDDMPGFTMLRIAVFTLFFSAPELVDERPLWDYRNSRFPGTAPLEFSPAMLARKNLEVVLEGMLAHCTPEVIAWTMTGFEAYAGLHRGFDPAHAHAFAAFETLVPLSLAPPNDEEDMGIIADAMATPAFTDLVAARRMTDLLWWHQTVGPNLLDFANSGLQVSRQHIPLRKFILRMHCDVRGGQDFTEMLEQSTPAYLLNCEAGVTAADIIDHIQDAATGPFDAELPERAVALAVEEGLLGGELH